MGNFQQLLIWQKAKDLAVSIYSVTEVHEKLAKDFRLKAQMQAASVSIPSNIAEGDELGSNKQSIRHFRIAKGSTAEIITQIIIAQEIGYLDAETAQSLIEKYKHLSLMITNLINARTPKHP